jgi:hypothetical protein
MTSSPPSKKPPLAQRGFKMVQSLELIPQPLKIPQKEAFRKINMPQKIPRQIEVGDVCGR